MRFKIFEFISNELVLNKPEILLIPEFEKLWALDRNMCKEDKSGTKRLQAYKEFKYIWLTQDFHSDYMELNEYERITTSLNDCGLTEAQVTTPEMVAAIRKYNKLQETKIIKLLKAAYGMIDKLETFFLTVDLNERDTNSNKLIHNSKDAISNLSNLGKAVEGLSILEYRVKKDMEAKSGVRGDASPGLYD
jgi:hypothetical protein